MDAISSPCHGEVTLDGSSPGESESQPLREKTLREKMLDMASAAGDDTVCTQLRKLIAKEEKKAHGRFSVAYSNMVETLNHENQMRNNAKRQRLHEAKLDAIAETDAKARLTAEEKAREKARHKEEMSCLE